jgi:hypothetical protein
LGEENGKLEKADFHLNFSPQQGYFPSLSLSSLIKKMEIV